MDSKINKIKEEFEDTFGNLEVGPCKGLQFEEVPFQNAEDEIKEELLYGEIVDFEGFKFEEESLPYSENEIKEELLFEELKETISFEGFKSEEEPLPYAENEIKEELLFEEIKEVVSSEILYEKKENAPSYQTQNAKKVSLFKKKENTLVPTQQEKLRCPKCTFQVKSARSLKVHLKLHEEKILYAKKEKTKNKVSLFKEREKPLAPTQQKKLQCTNCLFQAKSVRALKLHLTLHKEEMGKLEKLNLVMASKSIDENETPNRDKNKVKKCSQCEYKTTISCNLNRHIECMHSEQELKCPHCSYITNAHRKLMDHLSVHILDSGGKRIRRYHCQLCSHETDRKDRMKVHILNHSDKTVYECFCGYSSNNQVRFTCHSKIHEKNRFSCTKCNFNASNRMDLEEHFNSHGLNLKYSCAHCTFKTNLKRSLQRHLFTHSEGKIYLCGECDYGSNYKHHLHRHYMKHSDLKNVKDGSNFNDQKLNKKFSCSECDYRTGYKDCITNHLRTHNVTHACSQCNYKTNIKRKYRIHLLTHSDKRLLRCLECDYATLGKKNLTDHLRTHENKHYKCIECSYRTNNFSSLKMHSWKHSDKKRFSCLKCNYKTNFKPHLKTHHMKKHKN